MRAFKFIKKLKYSTVRLLREYFSNVQTIIKKKKSLGQCATFKNLSNQPNNSLTIFKWIHLYHFNAKTISKILKQNKLKQKDSSVSDSHCPQIFSHLVVVF